MSEEFNENIKKAKLIGDALKDAKEIPQEAKAVAQMGAILGASNDSIIHGLVAMTDKTNTDNAEKKNKPQDKPRDYSNIESIIHDMLTENTGVAMLDSGGAYGRAWQRNRQITDFRKNEEITMDVSMYKDKPEVSFSLDIFHYLTSFLEYDELCSKLEASMLEFGKREENKELYQLGLYEEFADKILKDERGYEVTKTFNSYNGDSILSQVIQGLTFEANNDNYIILQIHGGCDVRGGYTDPRIFKITDIDYFILAQYDVRLNCGCKDMDISSDDCGYHWYYQGCSAQQTWQNKENGFPNFWKAKKVKGSKYDYILKCQKCKQTVKPYAQLEY